MVVISREGGGEEGSGILVMGGEVQRSQVVRVQKRSSRMIFAQNYPNVKILCQIVST